MPAIFNEYGGLKITIEANKKCIDLLDERHKILVERYTGYGVSKKGNRTLMCYRAFNISTCVAGTTRLLASVCHRYRKI